MSPPLNPAQRAAVEHDLGPLLVLAGAGSGKTRVVTHRIARLLGGGVPARAILAVTFTNKAAAEMRSRVLDLVGAKAARELDVCTFHRFGLKVLGAEARTLGLRGGRFAILDQADALGVLREALRGVRAGRNFDLGAVLARISAAKNAFVEPEAWLAQIEADETASEYDEIAALLYPRYISALRSLQAFDFDDLLCEVVRLWRKREEVLGRWRMRYRYLIVDEYQDTNHAQLELVRLLGDEHKNVCVVGDDDQSIYAWRGADVRNILEFEEHFPGARVVKLEENYRSTKPILDVANAVLAKSGARRHQKTLFAARQGGDKVQVVVALDPDVEAKFVADEIERLVEQGKRPRDFAVLYRSNLQSATIESALKERRIPARVVGGTSLYERKEVKDVIAYLRVVLDSNDEMSLRRILNYPARGIGDVAIARLSSHATAHDLSLWDTVARAHAVHELPPAASEGCRQLVCIVEAARTRFERGEPPPAIARALVEEIALKHDIQEGANNPQAAARRCGNVDGLLALFDRRQARGGLDRDTFHEFLRYLSLREDGADEDAGDRVTLTTIHGAKGLEFPIVFVVGLEEGLMPHARSLDERVTDVAVAGSEMDGGHSIEEERRLFYVAVTRARDRLYLCRARQRAMRGKNLARTPSRFLLEVPTELIEVRDIFEPAAPPMTKVLAGAASVLAALSFDNSAAGGPVRRRS